MFEDDDIFEMTLQYEVLDTITTDKEIGPSYQRFTNTDGMIFLLGCNGKVYCFDPFCEKKVTEIQDLNED